VNKAKWWCACSLAWTAAQPKPKFAAAAVFDRLDQTALKTVLGWKYSPGKVNGEPKAMWFNVPINFVLE
jgi:protein TonB